MTPEELFAEHKARLDAGQPAPLKLALLEPGFFRYETRIEDYETDKGKVTGPREYRIPVATLAEAQCILFLCPICVHKQGHQVEVTFAGRGVLDHQGNQEPFLKFLNVAISEWLQARCGLPIDFQFQRAKDANAEFDGPRNGVGL